MLTSTAISRIKAATHDISDEYSTEECIRFLNTAIQQVSSLLIAGEYPALVKQITVHNGETLPKNFMKAAGTYPLCMTNGVVELLDDEEVVEFRYWATPEELENETDELPYTHDGINDVIVKTAVLLALNQNEYDITADNAIMTALQQAIASGMAFSQ